MLLKHKFFRGDKQLKTKKLLSIIAVSALLVVMILDTKSTIIGARGGIDLCINCIIPSLLPFSFLSKLLCTILVGSKFPFTNFSNHITGIPKGAEAIFVVSLIGGYPIGAICINDAYNKGTLSHEDSHRLLGFCNNAGPAFIFGVMHCVFPDMKSLFCLYLVHLVSAIIVSLLLPNKTHNTCKIKNVSIPVTKLLEETVKNLAQVCGWIVLFKILLSVIHRWFAWTLSPIMFSIITGFLELSNGCVGLQTIENYGLKFILSAGYLGFGGICVALQTYSATNSCGLGMYFPGKVLHTLISICLATMLQYLLFTHEQIYTNIPPILLLSGISIAIFTVILRKLKKVVAFA